jgi:two-component system heavy metal sensor histidine kinase CusS
MLFHSIRLRLTVWYSAVLLAGLILFGLLLWVAVRHYLLSTVDQRLLQGAAGVRAVLEHEVSAPDFLEELREYAHAAPGGALLQVRDDSGAELLPSTPLQSPGAGERYRTHTERVSIGGRTFEITAGADLSEVQRMLGQFRSLLLIAIPFVVAVAFGGAYWISRRALSPVGELTSAAMRISVENLSDRLPVRRTGDELQRLAETWNEMLARLEAAVRRITSFTADASHELRTPVSVILTTAELALRRERDAGQYRAALTGIVAEAQRTTGMIEDLLALARADSSHAPLPFEPVDLGELAREIAGELAIAAESRNVEVRTEADPSTPPVRVNRAALRRLLLILLDNALKYSRAGGRIEVTVAPAPGGAMLAVRDDGVGIAPEDVPHVFDRFYRADKSRSAQNGAGLGLSIAQAIAQMHGSKIQVESAPGRGSRFFLALSAVLQTQRLD